MKLLKCTLSMIILFTINPMSARPIAGRKTKPAAKPATMVTAPTAPQQRTLPATVAEQQKPLPALLSAPGLPSQKSFQYYMQTVRHMKPADVIDQNGVFTDKFENFVKSSGFLPAEMKALMQAGRNLHLSLSGDNDQDIELTAYVGERIDGFMQENVLVIKPVKPEEVVGKKLTVSDIEEMLYYDVDNALLKQNYLEKRVKELLLTKSASQVIAMLEQELGLKMRRSWLDHNLGQIPMRTKQLNQQIRDTVNAVNAMRPIALSPLEKDLTPADIEYLMKVGKTGAISGKPLSVPAALMPIELAEVEAIKDLTPADIEYLMKVGKTGAIPGKPLSIEPTTDTKGAIVRNLPSGTADSFEQYIKNLTAKNQQDVLNNLFIRMRSGFYAFKDRGDLSKDMINDMKEHLINVFPGISTTQIIDAIAYGIRAGLNVKLAPDPKPLLQFIQRVLGFVQIIPELKVVTTEETMVTPSVITKKQTMPVPGKTPDSIYDYAGELINFNWDLWERFFTQDNKGVVTFLVAEKPSVFKDLVREMGYTLKAGYPRASKDDRSLAIADALAIKLNIKNRQELMKAVNNGVAD